VRIVIVCVGKVRAPFADDIAHYERLLSRNARLETIEVPEADGVPRRIPKDSYVCILDREGKQISSEELARFLEERRSAGRDLCFVIGGPFGLDPAVLERVDARISFGPLTLPHQLARVVLLEQLFRAHKIVLGEPYHY
jgi:23S rRNA (pseudouridine1915-N3)-methyltransferase